MFNFIAVALATILIPTVPANSVLQESNSSYREQTAYVQQANSSTATIYTFNDNEPVEVYCPPEADSDTLTQINERFDGPYINSFGEQAELVSGVDYSVIKSASTTYNDFAYAFYMYWGGDIACEFKKEEVAAFFNDNSFVEVKEPQENDIVVYACGNIALHAGIIKNVLSKPANKDLASNLIVQSKWFDGGLYRHRGDLCPYTRKYCAIKFSEDEIIPTNLIYYRRHIHSYIMINNDDNSKHTLKCSGCNKVVEEYHRATDYKKYNNNQHIVTCWCGKEYLEIHTWTAYAVVFSDVDFQALSEVNLQAVGDFVKCKYCGLIRKLGDHEIVPIVPNNIVKDVKDFKRVSKN